MTLQDRAIELCDEWFPEPANPTRGQRLTRILRIQQLTATLKNTLHKGYTAGYNDCIIENLAVKKNAVRPIAQPIPQPQPVA